jgi:protein-S-isoprenylcysteine O-methyltransferase Ste14
MQNQYRTLINTVFSLEDPLYSAAIALLWITALLLLSSVVGKFVEYHFKRPTRKQRVRQTHIVETFSMSVVIVIIFNLLQLRIGEVQTDSGTRLIALLFGGVLVLMGTVLHIWAKIAIGGFWSNQMEVQQHHQIVTAGPYAIVRHPMYSSIILWLIGNCVVFFNYMAVILTLLLFIPMMIWRSRGEDKLLQKIDTNAFAIYSRNVSQLIPRFANRMSTFLRLLVIAMLAFTLLLQEISHTRIALLMVAHLLTGIFCQSPKVRFSFINKSFIMLVIYAGMLIYSPLFWLFYIILFFDIWGLFGNCPCMFIYEKYNGCPCFDGVKSLFKRIQSE